MTGEQPSAEPAPRRDEPPRPAVMDDRRLLILTEDEIDLLKDALWCAALVEQLAASGDAGWERAFLADLRAFVQQRWEAGKPAFRDQFLEITGRRIEELPADLRRLLTDDVTSLPTASETIALIGMLRLEIGRLAEELAAARQALALEQARRRRWWWPFGRRSRTSRAAHGGMDRC